MPLPVVGQDNAIGAWIAREVGTIWKFGCGRAIGWVDAEGRLLGGVSFRHYDGRSIVLEAASVDKRWLDRAGLFYIFHYCFVQLKCARATVFIPESNDESLKLVKWIGFTEEAALERAAPDGGRMLILRLFPEDCVWVQPRELQRRMLLARRRNERERNAILAQVVTVAVAVNDS